MIVHGGNIFFSFYYWTPTALSILLWTVRNPHLSASDATARVPAAKPALAKLTELAQGRAAGCLRVAFWHASGGT